VYFKILLENYDKSFTQITNDHANQLTGDASISISTVPTEYLDENDETLETGYIFSYFSSSAPAVPLPSSATLTVTFALSVPGNFFYQLKQVQAISGLQFVVGLVSLAGGDCWNSAREWGVLPLPVVEENKGNTKIDTPMTSL